MTSLTVKDLYVAKLHALGLRAKDVGILTGRSARTVQKHEEHIHHKLGVRSQYDVTRYMLRSHQLSYREFMKGELNPETVNPFEPLPKQSKSGEERINLLARNLFL